MKLFHGTSAEFTNFELPKEVIQHEYYGEALYFSDNFSVARYYGKRVIEIDIPETVITLTIDAGGKGMKKIGGLREMVKVGGVIEIKNVVDYNLDGAQVKQFALDAEDCGEYLYFLDFVLPIMKMSKTVASKTVSILNECGINATMLVNHPLGGYNLYVNGSISEEQARLALSKGVTVLKAMQKTPKTATTVIFAGEQGIDVLHRFT